MRQLKLVSKIKDWDVIVVPYYADRLEVIRSQLHIAGGYILSQLSDEGKSIFILEDDRSFVFVPIKRLMNYKTIQRTLWAEAKECLRKVEGELRVGLYLDLAFENTVKEAILQGVLLADYQPDINRGVTVVEMDKDLEVLIVDHEDAEPLIAETMAVVAVQYQLMDLINRPASHMNASDLTLFALTSSMEWGYQCRIYGREELRKMGMNAILSVNNGSQEEAKMAVLHYKGKEVADHTKTIGLVGKGVTFDTGGVSIKGAQNMHYMKSDMGGAAVVISAINLAARLELPIEIVGVVPCTDNLVDARASLPGDVIVSMSGKSIEIIDTDAEGRLIMADALYYLVSEFEPDIVMDIATLTGSAVRTFGYACGALMSNDDLLCEILQSAGDRSGDRLWKLPLWEEYASNLHSDVADIKNYSGRPICGAIDAGIFLQNFTNDHQHWAHLDIAGVSFGNVPSTKDKSATGYGPKLLLEFFKSIILNEL